MRTKHVSQKYQKYSPLPSHLFDSTFLTLQNPLILSMSYPHHLGCQWCGGPNNGGNCPGCSMVESGNGFVYDQNPYSYHETTNFFNQPPHHEVQTYSCEFCGGPHQGFDCQTRNTFVYEQFSDNNQNFGNDQYPYNSPNPTQQFYCCEYCGGSHYGSDCQSENTLVYEQVPGNNYDTPCYEQTPQYQTHRAPPQPVPQNFLLDLLDIAKDLKELVIKRTQEDHHKPMEEEQAARNEKSIT